MTPIFSMAATRLSPAVILPRFVLDRASEIYTSSQEAGGAVVYADGSEAYLENVLSRARDLSNGSEELWAAVRDFATLYHLSPERSNLLWPLRHLLTGDILEVGAGCGAVTRFLGEHALHVTAVEGSTARAKLCRMRCRDLRNVDVYAAPLQEIGGRQFDAVVAIGVLEYSPMFLGPNGPAEFLKHCRSLLRPGGILVLAIENKFGLKYFAGAAEDHLGKAFAGVENLYSAKTPVTFGRRELGRKLRQAEFNEVEFLYPFPDYKFARSIFPAPALAAGRLLTRSMLRLMAAQDQNAPYVRTFSEEMAWPGIAENGLAEDLANSFLVIASNQPIRELPSSIHVFASRRKKPFAKVTVLDPMSGRVTYRKLYQSTAPDGPYRQELRKGRIYHGKLLVENFLDAVAEVGWNVPRLHAALLPWTNYLAQHDDGTGHLPPDFVDCVPANLIQDASGKLHRLDQEWIAPGPIALSTLLVRGVVDCFERVQSVAQPAEGVPLHVVRVAAEFLSLCGIRDPETALQAALDSEVEFQSAVAIVHPSVRAEYQMKMIPPPRNAGDIFAREYLAMELRASRMREADLASQIEGLRASKAWRVGLALAKLVHAVTLRNLRHANAS